MVEVRTYHLPPTKLIPNSPRPLLHYPGYLLPSLSSTTTPRLSLSAPKVHKLFRENKWETQWIFRYGASQAAHYHSRVHECMAVLSGRATIRFGVADTSADLEESTHGPAKEDGGIHLQASAGDVFIVPAGVAHKTFDVDPCVGDVKLLTPGDGHHISTGKSQAQSQSQQTKNDADTDEKDIEAALAAVKLEGFTMIGAYPINSQEWNYAKGGEDQDCYELVWNVAKPEFDPVLGSSEDGVCGLWE